MTTVATEPVKRFSTEYTESRMVYPDMTMPPEPEFLINGFLERDTLTLLTAASGLGKTSLCFMMAKSITTGEPFFGMNVDYKSKCVFIQYDMSVRQHTAYNIRHAPDCPIPMIQGDIMVEIDGETRYDMYDLTKTSVINNLIQFCQDKEIGVVFIDTLSAAFPHANENDNGQMSDILMGIKMLPKKGITTVMTHHVSKAEYGYGTTTRGASSITAVVDAEIKMKESSRNLISVDATKTRYGGTGHKFYCRYDNGRIVMAERKKDHSVGVKRVMEAMRESELPMSRKDILEATKLGTAQLQQALEDAVANNLLVKNKVNKADVYMLAEDENT
jgi:RecA-family ATPase